MRGIVDARDEGIVDARDGGGGARGWERSRVRARIRAFARECAFPRAAFACIRASVQTRGGKHDARDARTDGTMSS